MGILALHPTDTSRYSIPGGHTLLGALGRGSAGKEKAAGVTP